MSPKLIFKDLKSKRSAPKETNKSIPPSKPILYICWAREVDDTKPKEGVPVDWEPMGCFIDKHSKDDVCHACASVVEVVGYDHEKDGHPPPSNSKETTLLASKGWREGEDDAIMESKGDGISEQGGEFALAKSHANKEGTVKVDGEVPPT